MSVNDNILNMEYESQVMVSESDYHKIITDNSNSGHICRIIKNENAYFDTPDSYIINHQMVLRVRTINNDYQEITLKIEEPSGVRELNYKFIDTLDNNLKIDFKNHYPEIYNALKDRNINLDEVRYITTLTTNRLEVEKPGYLLVIDKNSYGNITDYNIEVESDSLENARKYLKEEMDKYHIEIKKNYIVKSKRAILEINKNK